MNTTNSHAAKAGLEKMGLRSDRIFVLPNAVEEQYFSFPPAAVPADQPVRILWLANNRPFKRLDVAARCFQALLKRAPGKFHMVIAGLRTDGPQEQAQFCDGAGPLAKSHISFVGPVKDVARAMSECQVFLLSSDYEGMPNTVNEAMASGLCVVARPAGGTVELVEDKVTGRICSEEDLPATLGDVVLDRAAILRYGTAARASAADRGGLKALADNLLHIYGRILEAG